MYVGEPAAVGIVMRTDLTQEDIMAFRKVVGLRVGSADGDRVSSVQPFCEFAKFE